MGVELAGLPPRVAAMSTALDAIAADANSIPWAVSSVPSGRLVNASLTATGIPSVSLGTNTTLQTLVDVTGSGILRLCILACTGTSAATLRLVITTDGVTILNYTSPSASAARALWGVGSGTGPAFQEWDIPYRSSLVIQAQQSAAVTSTLYYINLVAAPFA